MPAHHKPTPSGVRDPHGGPLPGDANYRLHFPDAQSFSAAMEKAARLEAKGMHRRAWRVRWNLDGAQPEKIRLILEDDDDDAPPKPITASRRPLALDQEYRDSVARMIKQTQLSHRKLAIQLRVSQQAVSRWALGAYISKENYENLRTFVEGMKK